MFEGVAAYILNKYLGKYIQDLDSESLNIGIFSGTIQLTDLQLKTEALYELELPIEVKAGCIGKISMDIPWMTLYSDPVLVHIEDILIIAGAITDRPYNQEMDKRLMRALKRTRLEDLLEPTIEMALVEKPRGFFENLIATIINNIQVSVQNIHIRYEDVISYSSEALSCGIALQAFTAITVNNKWKPTQIDGEAKNIFKLIKVESFSVYWNPSCQKNSLVKSLLPSIHWKNVMKKGLATFSVGSEEFEFLVKPISAKAKLIFNKSAEDNVPRLLVDFVLQDAALQFSRAQYLSVLGLQDRFQTMTINCRYRKYQPASLTIKRNAKNWWRYAYKAIIEEFVRPYSWTRIKAHRNTLRKYQELYQQRLHHPGDTEVRLDLQKVEDNLDLTSIVIAREAAKLEFIKQSPAKRQRKVKGHSWWLSWFVGQGPEELEEELEIMGEQEKSIWSRLTNDEKENLYQAIGYMENSLDLETSAQYIAHKLNFTLANCTMSLVNDNREIFILTLTQFLTSMETRPGAQAFKISARTESFIVEGASIENELVPIITADNIMSGSLLTHVFVLDFEKNPLHVNADFGLNINAEPIEVVYQEHSISHLLAFFAVPNLLPGEMQYMALEKLHSLALLSRAGLEYAVSKHKTVHLNVDFKSPYFVIPEHGTIQKGGSVLVLDMGRLTVKSDLQPDTLIPEDATKMEIEETLYDRFSITLSEIQVLFSDSGDEWRLAKQTPESDIHLMPKVRVQLLYSSSIKPEYKLMPSHKLNISIPSLKLSLSDRRLRLLMEFVQNLPVPDGGKILNSSTDETDGFESEKYTEVVMNMKELKMDPNKEELKRLRNSFCFHPDVEICLKDNISFHEAPINSSSQVFSTSEHSDEEPEEWARMVDLPGFDDNVSPSNNLFMLFRLTIGELVVHLSRSSDHNDKPYLMVRMEKLCADIAAMDYGPAIQASLGGIQLIDKLHCGSSGEYLELVKSESKTDMFTFLYRKVQANCPEFKSHFHQVEHSLVLDLSSLVVTFHREAFMTLGRFLMYVSEKLKPLSEEKMYKTLMSDVSLDATSLSILNSISDPPVPPGATKFSISARVGNVKLRLCDTDINLARVNISGLECDYILKANDKMVIRVNLTELSVEDLMESTLYPKILSIDDDKVFDFKYMKHSPHHKEMGNEEDTATVHRDGTLRLRVGRMQIVLLQRFFNELQRFVEPFVQPSFTTRMAKSAEKAVVEQFESMHQQSLKLQLLVDIRAPTVIVPQKSSSPNLLVFGLGDLSIENFFQEAPFISSGGTKHFVDNILVRLNSLKMSRAIILLDGSVECQEDIVEPVKLRIDIKRALAPYHTDMLMYEIRGSLDMIKVCIGQRDISTLIAIYHENVSEGEASLFKPVASPASPGELRTPAGHRDEYEDDPVKKLEVFLNSSNRIKEEMKFIFLIEGLQVVLYTDVDEVLSSPVRDPTKSLSKLLLDEVSFIVERMSDTTTEYRFSLQSVLLEDTRPDSNLAIKKIFQSYLPDSQVGNSGSVAGISISMPPVIDLTYKYTSSGDASMDVIMEKMRFNISVPYLLAVLKFFHDSLPTYPHQGAVLHSVDGIPVPAFVDAKGAAPNSSYHLGRAHRRLPSDTTSGYHSTLGANLTEDAIKSLTICGAIKKPELIFFADPSDENSQVIMMKTDIIFDFTQNVGQQNLMAHVSGLHILSCSYKRRKQTMYSVLSPCDLQFSRSQKFVDEEVNMAVNISALNIKLSTPVMQTVLHIVSDLQADIQAHLSYGGLVDHSGGYYEFLDLWNTKPITPNKWLAPLREPVYVKPSYPKCKPKETLTVSLPELIITCEMANWCGELSTKNTLALLIIKSALEAEIHNWSKQAFLKAVFELQIMYFNEKLSHWEPLLEPVMESENNYKAWECEIKLFQEQARPIVCRHDRKIENIMTIDTVDSEITSSSSRIMSDTGSSSESDLEEGDLAQESKTIIRRKTLSHTAQHRRAGSQKSHDYTSLAAYPPDSDSETDDNIFEKITSDCGHLFSGESSDDDDDDDGSKTDSEEVNGDSGENKSYTEEQNGQDEVDGSIEERPVFLMTNKDEPGDCAVEEEAQTLGTYIVIESKDHLNFNMSPVALSVLKEVLETFSGKPIGGEAMYSVDPTFSKSLVIRNFLGPQTKVAVLKKDEHLGKYNVVEEMIGMEIKKSPDTHHAPLDILVDLGSPEIERDLGDETDGFSMISAVSNQTSQADLTAEVLTSQEEGVTELFNKSTKERVSIEIEGFEKFQCLAPTKVGTTMYALHPIKNNTRYYFLVDVDMEHGTKTISAMSPLQIENHLTRPIHVMCLKASLDAVGASVDDYAKNPFHSKYVQLATLESGQVYNVPLLVAYHCQIFFQPAATPADLKGYSFTSEGLWWPDMEALQCQSKCLPCLSQSSDDTIFVIKAVCLENKHIHSSAMCSKQVPNYTFHLHPPVILHNSLPYSIELTIKKTNQQLRLEEGERIPLYDIQQNQIQGIQVEIPSYLGHHWTGLLEVSTGTVEHRTIVMEPESKTPNKNLCLVAHISQEHSLDVYLHSPYWVVNKTGLPLSLRGSSSDVLFECPPILQEPLLFRFKKHRRKKVKLRVYNSKWSHSFSIDVVGNRGILICVDKERKKKYRFFVSIELSGSKLTKILTLQPYYIIVNNSKKDLRFTEENESADLWTDLAVNDCLPYWPHTDSMKMFVKHKESAVVSQHFPVNTNHTTVLRMENGTAMCVEVTGGTENPTVVSFFAYCPGDAPVRVENLCEDIFLKIHQKFQGQVTLLTPNQSVLYTWDDPTVERTLTWNVYNLNKSGFQAHINKDGWGHEKVSFHSIRQQLLSTSLKNRSSVEESSSDDDDSELDEDSNSISRKTRKDKAIVYWVSYLDGLQRVLLFTQDERIAKQARKFIGEEYAYLELFLSLSGVGVSLVNGMLEEVAYMGAQCAPALWEVEVNHSWKLFPLELSTWLEDKYYHGQQMADFKDRISVNIAKMKMVKPFFASLRRTFSPAIWCQYRKSAHHQLLHAKVHRLQIDNQLCDAIFPTVLYPMPIAPAMVRRFSPRPFIEFKLFTHHNSEINLDTIKYFNLLVQEFAIKLDKGFVLSVYDMFLQVPSPLEEEEIERLKIKEDLHNIGAPLQILSQNISPVRSQRTVFEYLHLSPIKFHLSFSSRGKVHKSQLEPSSLQQDVLDFFLSSIGATLTEVKDIEIKMAFFERNGVVASLGQILTEAQAHYRNQIIQQSYVLILGLDVLGNPYGLVKDFTKGLGDCFYEPFLGSLFGPDEFAEGLARGAQSFMGHVVGGTAGSISLITESLGQALVSLSFDEEYKKKRRRRFQQQTASLPDSLVLAAKSFGQGVILGLTGVVVKPITGAQYEGLEGFFKGFGKGILGLLTKPAGGVFDMVSMAFDGIRRAAEIGEHVVVHIRLPRFINPSQGLKAYSPYQAIGNRILQTLSKGHYAEADIYWGHAALGKDDNADMTLITNRHLFLLQKCRFWGDYDIQWVVRIDDILSVPKVSNSRIVIHVREDDALMSLTGSERHILCDDQIALEWLKAKIEKVLLTNMQDKPCAQCV